MGRNVFRLAAQNLVIMPVTIEEGLITKLVFEGHCPYLVDGSGILGKWFQAKFSSGPVDEVKPVLVKLANLVGGETV